MFARNQAVKENILCVAFLYSKDDKKIILSLKRPLRHHHIVWKYGQYIKQLKDNGFEETQGFLTNTNKFVNRIDGLKIAINANQILKKILVMKNYIQKICGEVQINQSHSFFLVM